MAYPTLDQYNAAIQNPKIAFFDNELKNGTVKTTQLGLPLAFCGGFALTYNIQCGNKKFAVRCFHKESSDIELRYKAISNKIHLLQSPYFVGFEFQKIGINVNGNKAPVVKMAWASGETLGEFLAKNFRDKNKLQSLNQSLSALAIFLEGKGIAHGDIQPGNVMVASEGKTLQLIDYDGMYLDELKSLGSENDGQRNFQHPKRDKRAWNAQLDRFSFIELNLALRILEFYPHFWDKTKSDADSILFRANDFADPGNSRLFSELFGLTQFSVDAKNFASICQSQFDRIPTLEDFVAKQNIPQITIISAKSTATIQQYIGAFPVLNADNYGLCLKYVGDRVELIGQIIDVTKNKTYRGKPYIFINFGDWRGEIVKVTIWSEGLAVLSDEPDSSWIGKWLTVTGLMEPPYHSNKYNYTHLSISITQANQLHTLEESEARYRLASTSTNAVKEIPVRSNRKILEGMKGKATSQPTRQTSQTTPISNNQRILQNMRQQQSQTQQVSTKSMSTGTYQRPAPKKDNCFIASAIYGASALETNILRKWRDENLLPYLPGRLLTNFYYFVSPSICKFLVRHEKFNKITRNILDRFIALITR